MARFTARCKGNVGGTVLQNLFGVRVPKVPDLAIGARPMAVLRHRRSHNQYNPPSDLKQGKRERPHGP